MTSTSDTHHPTAEPHSFDEFYRQGWALHGQGDQDAAEASARKALAIEPQSVDGLYVLGLILKAQGRGKEAAEVFERVVALLDQHLVEDETRRTMLRRLALGHINHIRTGDWNLEKEIWQHRE